jgi:hypothetical protein
VELNMMVTRGGFSELEGKVMGTGKNPAYPQPMEDKWKVLFFCLFSLHL